MKTRNALLGAALLLTGVALAQDMDLQVQLMGPLGTKISHKGDRIFARVVQPDALKGDMVEGTVKEVRSGGKLRGNSVLNFSFETLQHAGQAIPINTQIKSFQNSKGQADVDDEGRVIRKGGGNTTKALGGTAAGGLIGGLAGGLKGAAIGAGVGAAASIAVIEIAADSPEIRFNPGSVITVSAKSRSGPDLATLAGAPAPPPTSAAVAPAAVPASGAPVAPPSPAVAPGESPMPQPNLTLVKADFLPGEKTLFYDDFTDMAGDEAPPHWRVRGASMHLKIAPGIRQLTTPSQAQKVALRPNFRGLPKNFTLETEVMFETETNNPGDLRSTWYLHPKGSDANALRFETWTAEAGALTVKVKVQDEEVATANVMVNYSQPVQQGLWVQNGRLRLYINGNRIADVNQIDLPVLDAVDLEAETFAQENRAIGYRMVRIAESTPDFSQIISSTGRYVTHGINFDTDSDRLKTDSAAVIKMIAQGLQKNPNLKLRIEGHTDSTGAADHNLDLSKRRAEAVKSVLVAQFGMDAARLTTDGMGSSKPVDSNDTPQGRANNRRVEFVKQ